MTAPIIFNPRTKIVERIGTSKPSKGEAARIKVLGEMDDRHKKYLAERNREALLGLAIEYECLGNHGLPRKAAEIRLEVENIK